MEISWLEPELKVRPMTSPAGALPRVAKALAVSVTKVKSRVGSREPSRISVLPAATWLMMVEMTARADWRGPKVLNGRRVTTGVWKLRW